MEQRANEYLGKAFCAHQFHMAVSPGPWASKGHRMDGPLPGARDHQTVASFRLCVLTYLLIPDK